MLVDVALVRLDSFNWKFSFFFFHFRAELMDAPKCHEDDSAAFNFFYPDNLSPLYYYTAKRMERGERESYFYLFFLGGGGFLSSTNPRHDKWIVSVYSVEKSSKHQRDEPQQTDNEMKVKE